MTDFHDYHDPFADELGLDDHQHQTQSAEPQTQRYTGHTFEPQPEPMVAVDPNAPVPFPADFRFTRCELANATAAGMIDADISAVLDSYRAKNTDKRKTVRGWEMGAGCAISAETNRRRRARAAAEAVKPRAPVVGMQPQPRPEPQPETIESRDSEPDAASSTALDDPDWSDEWEGPAPEVDVVPDEPAWFREMYRAGMDAIDEAANDDDSVPPEPDDAGKMPAEASVQEKPVAEEKPKRKPRARAEKPKRLMAFSHSDRAAWVTAVNLERGMSVAGMKAAAFLGIVHNGTTGVSFYGQIRMAKMMGTSRSTAQAGIDALVKAGFLGRERVWREGRQNSNRYVIQMPAKVAKFRRTDTFIDSFGPEIREEYDRDSGRDGEEDDRGFGHGGDDQCPGFRASDDRESGHGMTEIPGTNKEKGTRRKNQEKKLAGNSPPIDESETAPPRPETVQPSRSSHEGRDDRGKVPMPDDLTFSVASLALARAAGLSSVDIEAAMTSFREKFGAERRTRGAWDSAIAGWLKRQRPAPKVQGAACIDGPRHDRRGTPLDDTSIPGSFYERENIRAWLMTAKGLYSAEAVRDAVRRFDWYYRQEMTGDMKLNVDWPAALFHWLKWQDAIAFAAKHQGRTPKRTAI